ncbi:WD40-repeat-containing domain protein [Entophlyctis helioformis]|nr:WD40-repeat-containing domain protein [Entophlyctis helioformis]
MSTAAASEPVDDRKVQVVFYSRQPKYAVTDTPILVPTRLRRYGLSEIINHLLALASPVPFDFIIDGKFLKASLQKYIDSHVISTENILRVEFVEASLPPKNTAILQHDDWISSVKIHSTLPFILTGSYDGLARVWSKTGVCAQTLAGHSAPVKTVAWVQQASGKGSYVLTGSQDQRISAFHVSDDGKESSVAYECLGHQGSVEALAVSDDAAFFASGSWDKTVRVWTADADDVETTEEERSTKKRMKLSAKKAVKTAETVLEGHADAVTCVAFASGSASATTVYSGSQDHSVRQWDVQAEANTSTMNCETVVNCMSYSKESQVIATGHADRAVRLFDPRSTNGFVVKMKFSSHTNWVSSVAWSPSSGFNLASGSYDGTVKVWDVRSTSAVYTLDAADPDTKVFGLDWSGELLCMGGEDTKLRTFFRN